MLDKIKENLRDPEALEKLYRDDRKAFKAAFDNIFPEIKTTEPAKFWKVRLEFDNKPEIMKVFSLSEIIMVIIIGLITAILIKLPDIFPGGWSDTIFYYKNGAIIVFFGLTLYTVWMSSVNDLRRIIMTALAFLVPLIYINLLPFDEQSDPVTLVHIHLPMLMWFIYGIVFTGHDFRNLDKRIDYIRFNGDLAIVYTLMAIAGGLLTAITIGLFNSIGLNIEEFYARNIVISGVVAVPVVSAYLIEKFPSLVSKTAPLIAGIFSPLVFVTLIAFLITIAVTGKDPYNNRDFLLLFNVMLLGVMAIIIFSVSETSVIKNQKFNAIVLFALSITTIITDLIALSAILYRLGEYGLTPNRLAVLASNLLILANLILIMTDLFKINFRKKEFRIIEMTISKFLPVYLLWIIIVVFGFPLIFGLK
jgi:hypothetical protein